MRRIGRGGESRDVHVPTGGKKEPAAGSKAAARVKRRASVPTYLLSSTSTTTGGVGRRGEGSGGGEWRTLESPKGQGLGREQLVPPTNPADCRGRGPLVGGSQLLKPGRN